MSKYLVIKLVGHERVMAFENHEKKSEQLPDFKGDGVAIWVNEKRGVSFPRFS